MKIRFLTIMYSLSLVGNNLQAMAEEVDRPVSFEARAKPSSAQNQQAIAEQAALESRYALQSKPSSQNISRSTMSKWLTEKAKSSISFFQSSNKISPENTELSIDLNQVVTNPAPGVTVTHQYDEYNSLVSTATENINPQGYPIGTTALNEDFPSGTTVSTVSYKESSVSSTYKNNKLVKLTYTNPKNFPNGSFIEVTQGPNGSFTWIEAIINDTKYLIKYGADSAPLSVNISKVSDQSQSMILTYPKNKQGVPQETVIKDSMKNSSTSSSAQGSYHAYQDRFNSMMQEIKNNEK